MTDDNAIRSRRKRERRKAGLVSVTIGDDRRPDGVRRGAITTDKARTVIKWMEEQEAKGGHNQGTAGPCC